MSYDLLIWDGPAPKDEAAMEAMLEALEEAVADDEREAPEQPSARVAAFLDELHRQHPDLARRGDDDYDTWPETADPGNVAWLYLPWPWDHPAVPDQVTEIAERHGLNVFNPQQDDEGEEEPFTQEWLVWEGPAPADDEAYAATVAELEQVFNESEDQRDRPSPGIAALLDDIATLPDHLRDRIDSVLGAWPVGSDVAAAVVLTLPWPWEGDEVEQLVKRHGLNVACSGPDVDDAYPEWVQHVLVWDGEVPDQSDTSAMADEILAAVEGQARRDAQPTTPSATVAAYLTELERRLPGLADRTVQHLGTWPASGEPGNVLVLGMPAEDCEALDVTLQVAEAHPLSCVLLAGADEDAEDDDEDLED